MKDEITNKQRNYTLFVLVLVFTSSHVDRQIMGILGQPIKESLLISDTQLGLLTGIMFAVFYATLGMPMAMWADRHNRRNLISFSVFLWSLMTALCGAASNFMQLLLMRIGVGVGEAGSNPPSHSIIADLYPPEKRATAMAIFGTGINWGILIGFLVGGWINEWYGWRTAFVVVGLPGILLAILVRFTVTEPPRGYSEALTKVTKAPAFWDVARFLFRHAALRNIIIASALISFTGYASVIWIPIYLVRIHDLGTGETGSYLALIIGVGGAIGIYLGGRAADYLSSRLGQQWLPWLVGIVSLAGLPFLYLAFTATSASSALWAYALPAAMGTIYVAPAFALIQNLTPIEMRSVAAAINLFITNIIGLGIGPFSVGFFSDLFEPRFGPDSLRYALMTTLVVILWACWHYYRTGALLAAQHRQPTH
ncbi:MAG: MFS transporter [Gammaproteobacteria bacterium]|jgi:predicted MFS family arabinose efflux permease|nr:MFS transporter [Gammaproteobacteria bacterium]MBT5203769.1 MFS transporter [Gammaproteobacteria bacterium]MBT5601814.1 MFS transporter [Gammaproteobacteria bacterium]MBT6247438.1 MFS transporter [Gammaproteobacteria bacterium]